MSPSLQTMGFFMSDINFCNTKEQLNHLGEVVTGKVDGSPSGADIDTSTLTYTGQVRKTLPALEGEYEQSITDKEAEADAAIDKYRLLNKGQYSAGITLESKFEYITYNGESYFATSPPYTTTATTPDADDNLFLGGYTTFENVASKIGNPNLLSNQNFLTPSPDTITHPNELPESYTAGVQIFSGVYAGASGVTVTLINGRVNCSAGDYYFKVSNTNGLDRVPVFTASVAGYDGNPATTGVSYALVSDEYVVTVTPAAGDVFSVKLEEGDAATRHKVETPKGQEYSFNSVQDMVSSGVPAGVKCKTGGTTWLITTSNRGWPLDNGLYALPLNGVHLPDLGADPNNGNDASDAFDLAIANYDVSNKRRFTLVGAGGDYNISRSISLNILCSRFKFNGSGATLTATADMDDMVSWPHISDVEIDDITFKLASGVSVTNAIVDGGKDAGSTDKSLRTKLRNLRAFEIADSPRFIQLNQEWEFKLENIRSDHDVSGQTGVNIELFSCVNGQVKTPEVGYSAVGIKFSKSANVTYQCEGIDLISPVTTFAAVGLKGDNVTSLKVLGGVLDFCLTRAWEFTNGTDVSFFGTWFANRSDSASSGTLGISQPSFSKIKLTACEFVNNQANAWNALSLNSEKCKATDNTSKGALNSGFTLDDLESRGNDFIPNTNTRAIVDTQNAPTGNGNATKKVMNSGENSFSANKLLHRNEYNAANINAANTWAMSTYAGNFSDQLYVAWEKSGVEQFRFDMVLGNLEISRSGKGIKFKSPDGLTTKTLTIDNSGNPVWS